MAGANALRFLSHLDSAFDPDAEAFVAFRVSTPSSSAFQWAVAGDVFTCTLGGAVAFSASLQANTVGSLASALASSGFLVNNLADATAQALSASILMDGTGSVNDPVMAFGSMLWAIGEAIGVELDAAGIAADQALLQVVMSSAEDVWLDLWGSYFGVPRNAGEADPDYASRIVVEVLRPRCNNVALELALGEIFGQSVAVNDVIEYGPATPQHDGLISFDGAHLHNATVTPLWGLFDVSVGYDLLGSTDPQAYLVIVTSIINRLRAAGTYLRALNLSGSAIGDAVARPTDAMSSIAVGMTLADSVTAPTDSMGTIAGVLSLGVDTVNTPTDTLTLSITYAAGFIHDGTYAFDGTKTHNAGATVSETL